MKTMLNLSEQDIREVILGLELRVNQVLDNGNILRGAQKELIFGIMKTRNYYIKVLEEMS